MAGYVVIVLSMLAAITVRAQPVGMRTRVVAYLYDSTAVSGTYESLEVDAILLRDGNAIRRVALDSVRTIALIDHRTDLANVAAVAGMLTGSLLFNPNGNTEDRFVPYDNAVLFAGAGGGLFVGSAVGMLLYPRDVDVQTDYHPSDTSSRRALFEHLSRVPATRPHWLVGIHSGSVNGTIVAAQTPALVADGYDISRPPVSDFALVRRIEVSRAVWTSIDAAATVVALGQVSSIGQAQDPLDSLGLIPGKSLREEYSGTGFLVGARYALPVDSGRFVIRAGASAGIAALSLSRGDNYSRFSNRRFVARQEVSAVTFSGLGSIELIGRFGGVVLGISADYTVVPSMQFDASEHYDVGETTVNMSSACIGAMIGLEF